MADIGPISEPKIMGIVRKDNTKKFYDGGGGNMNNDYVTHSELRLSEMETQRKLDKLDNKITQVDNKLDYKFNELDNKIDSKFDLLNSKLDTQNKLIWWIIRLLTAGVVLPAITYVIKTLSLK
ncbi:hypothetical protein [Ligilactobacillus salivarius]|uniref:hypothetical protein n=1 Tax=Ligilactobacillus salivarius TaxID=1624 RepID=UPI0009D9CFC8|nr:hypothetical protein [Ligilactobacillus salivarius]OQR15192.1 hypothetical protein B6U42_03475 [Ligilactobacillus salivarius]